MKTTLSFQRAALLALALGTASATATFAQTTNTITAAPATTTTAPSTTTDKGKKHVDIGSILTPAEQAQLKKAHDAALAADPTLKTEEDTLDKQLAAHKGQGKGGANGDQKKALKEQKKAFQKKLEVAELKIDPTLAPIFAKLKAAHKEEHKSK